MQALLVADIGGTHVRFALSQSWQHTPAQLSHQQVYRCAQFPNLADALSKYFAYLPESIPKRACIAMAGPVHDDCLKLTNLHWRFSAQSIRRQFQFQDLEFINDFTAQALATTVVPAHELSIIRTGAQQAFGTRAIVGPGTGLGIASLVWSDQRWLAIPGEGGHMTFAPSSSLEMELLTYLRGQLSDVSLETVLSGPGLRNIYCSLCAINNVETESHTTETIIAKAKTHSDAVCVQSLTLFLDILGRVLGDMALLYGARGGVYLGGGLCAHLLPFISDSQFLSQFIGGGIRADYLAAIPIFANLHPCPGLLGAAIAYQQKMASRDLAPVE